MALRLEDVFGLSAGPRGLVLTGLGVAGLATARLVGSGVDRIGPRRSVLLGAAATSPSVGVATQLVLVGVNVLVLRSSPVNRAGSMSLVQAIRFGGGSLAPVVFTPLYDVTVAGPFLLAAVTVAVVIPVALPRAQGPSTANNARA